MQQCKHLSVLVTISALLVGYCAVQVLAECTWKWDNSVMVKVEGQKYNKITLGPDMKWQGEWTKKLRKPKEQDGLDTCRRELLKNAVEFCLEECSIQRDFVDELGSKSVKSDIDYTVYSENASKYYDCFYEQVAKGIENPGLSPEKVTSIFDTNVYVVSWYNKGDWSACHSPDKRTRGSLGKLVGKHEGRPLYKSVICKEREVLKKKKGSVYSPEHPNKHSTYIKAAAKIIEKWRKNGEKEKMTPDECGQTALDLLDIIKDADEAYWTRSAFKHVVEGVQSGEVTLINYPELLHSSYENYLGVLHVMKEANMKCLADAAKIYRQKAPLTPKKKQKLDELTDNQELKEKLVKASKYFWRSLEAFGRAQRLFNCRDSEKKKSFPSVELIRDASGLERWMAGVLSMHRGPGVALASGSLPKAYVLAMADFHTAMVEGNDRKFWITCVDQWLYANSVELNAPKEQVDSDEGMGVPQITATGIEEHPISDDFFNLNEQDQDQCKKEGVPVPQQETSSSSIDDKPLPNNEKNNFSTEIEKLENDVANDPPLMTPMTNDETSGDPCNDEMVLAKGLCCDKKTRRTRKGAMEMSHRWCRGDVRKDIRNRSRKV